MKKSLILFSAFLLVLGFYGSVGAYTITYDSILAGDGTLTTNVAGATVETFDAALLWTWSGSGAIVQNSSSKFAAPYNSSLMAAPDSTKYVTVPDPASISSGSFTADLGGSYNYLGLFWGSVDAYNELKLYDGSTEVASFTGTFVANPSVANGNQTAPGTNFYVNFFDLPEFNKFTMISTSYAFEADNIAVAKLDVPEVPEPSTMLLLGLGLVFLGGYGRKKFK